MDKSMILLILNIIFALFIIGGFVSGLKGLKKSGVHFAFFLLGIIIASIITPYVSKSIMEMQITFEGTLMSLNDIILTVINRNAQIAELTSASPSINGLIQNIPLMLANVVMFVVLSYIMIFIAWIIYLVIANAILKQRVRADGTKPKKYRLLGGLIGAVQGLVLVFVTFLPISGIVGIVNDLRAQTVEVQAQEEQSDTAKLIEENLPQEVKDLIDAYSQSAISSFSGVFNTDDFVFNNVSSVYVNNLKISLRDEIINISKVYDNIGFLFNIKIDKISDLTYINYDKLLNAVDYIFNSNILKTALPELIDFGCDKVLEIEDIENQEYYELVEVITNYLTENNQTLDNLKNEIISPLKAAKIIAQEGIFNLIDENSITTEQISQILKILSKNNNLVLNNIIDELLNSKILNKGVIFGFNYGLNQLQTLLRDFVKDESITLGEIDLNTAVLNNTEIKSLLSSGVYIANEMIDVDYESLSDDYRKIFDLKLEEIILNVGNFMNTLQKMSILNQTIYNNIIDALSKTEYNEYVDISAFKNEIWLQESQNIANVLNKIKQSNIISFIEKNGNEYYVSQENITKILQNLSETNNGQTLIRQILKPIFDSNSTKKLLDYGAEQLQIEINNLLNGISENENESSINIDALHNENEKEKILTFVDEFVTYLKDIDLQAINDNPFMTLIKSNLSQLGSVIDSLKSIAIFGNFYKDDELQIGVYSKLVESLKQTEFTKYINFDVFLDDEFSFNLELTKNQSAINKLLEKNIIENDNSTSLLEYIINVGNWDIIFNQIDKQDLTDIFTPLLNSKLFEPLGTMVVNKINETIKSMVGTYGDNIDTDISSLDPDQIDQIIDVLDNVTDIIDEIDSDDFIISDLIKGNNSDSFVNLLNTLQDNANNDGVFASAYDSMVDYLKHDETIGEALSTKLQNYEDGQVNWAEIVESLKNV